MCRKKGNNRHEQTADSKNPFAVRFDTSLKTSKSPHKLGSRPCKDVTFNLCLGLDFTGAGLQFCGMSGAPDHRKHRHSYFHRKASIDLIGWGLSVSLCKFSLS